MSVSKYNCPLCNQPVSKSLFMQITGIWKAREKELAKVKAERSKLKNMQKQFKAEKKRLLKVQQAKLKAQADQRIAKAVKGAKGMGEELRGLGFMRDDEMVFEVQSSKRIVTTNNDMGFAISIYETSKEWSIGLSPEDSSLSGFLQS